MPKHGPRRCLGTSDERPIAIPFWQGPAESTFSLMPALLESETPSDPLFIEQNLSSKEIQ
jgi:hypothetical protein